MAWYRDVQLKAGAVIGLALLGLVWISRDHAPALPMLPIAVRAKVDTHDCTTLVLSSVSDRSGVLKEPGKYCIGEDFRQPTYSGAGHTWPGDHHSMVDLYSGDIDIDLQGHTLSATSSSRAINQFFGATRNRVRVHDGYIDLRSVGTGVSFVNKWSYMLRGADYPPPDAKVKYEKTQYILENLVIRTMGIAIQLEGDGNIIRNCIVESEGNAAIVIAGPNAIIENNKIILRNRLIPSEIDFRSGDLSVLQKILPSRARPRAAIVLRQASGAEIIGNSIEVEAASERRHAVYVKDESKDVLIQGNRFVGPIQPAFVELGSVVTERGNSFSHEK